MCSDLSYDFHFANCHSSTVTGAKPSLAIGVGFCFKKDASILEKAVLKFLSDELKVKGITLDEVRADKIKEGIDFTPVRGDKNTALILAINLKQKHEKAISSISRYVVN